MAITYRLVKGSSLTHLEMDDNFRSVIYSSSIRDDGDTLRLHYDTVTQGANSYVDIAIGMNDSGSVSIIGNDLGNVITATGNTGSFQGETNFNFLNNKLTITGSGASISINDQEGNMFIGLLAGYSATGSSNNIGIGDNASRNIEGTYNTTLGINSLQNATTSDENVVIGNNALQTLSSGDSNTALGASTGINNSSGDKNVYIGYAAGPSSSVSENDKLYINTVASDTPLILGDFVTQQLEFAGGVTGSSFTGSFVGDGSELTDLYVPGLKTVDDYIFTLQTPNLYTITGSNAPSSSIIVTNLSGDSFVHTPTEFGLPNANEMFIEDTTMWIGYNWTYNVYDSGSIDSAYKIVRLEDVTVDFDNSTLSYTVADNTYVSSSAGYFRQGSGNDISENYIFLSSIGAGEADISTGFQIARISKYDFTDIEIYQYPNNADLKRGDTLKYYNGYIYVQSQERYTNLKITKINAYDLTDYSTIITGTSGLTGASGVLEIYKNQIITTTGYLDTGILLLKYTLDGQLVDSNTIIPPTGSKEYDFNVPTTSTIKDNHLYITQLYSYTDVLKIDTDTLQLVDSLAISPTLMTYIASNIAIGKDGFLYAPAFPRAAAPSGSYNPPRLYKIDTTDLSFTEVFTLISGSFGSFTTKNQILRDLAKPFTYNFNGEYVGDLQINGAVTGSSFTGSFVGDGSELTGIDSEWDGSYIGDASITGSLTISGSGAILNTQEIQYDTIHAAAGHSTGRVFWDAAANTLAADMLGSDVTLQIGQETHLYAKNTSGITLVNGTAVRITGASGVNIEIGPTLSVTESISNTTIDQDQIIGLVTEDIANNGFGYVTTKGAVRGIDTSTFAAGDILYVSHTVTGSYSTSKPPSPFFTAKVGIVEVSNPSNGVILVSPSEPLHLTDLANITGSNVPAGISYLVHDDTTNIISFTSELSGSFSGSFAGDGSGLTGVVSSSVPYTTGSGTDSIQSAFNQADAGGVISVVAGGRNNTIASTGEASYIGAGRGNTITGSYSAILAGTGSNSKGQGSIILGGSENLIEASGINSSILAGKGGTVNFNASSIVSGDNIQAARKYTAHATSVYVTGSTAELVGDFGGVLQLARRETTPTLSGDYEGMIINSGSATRSDLYFYSGTNDGWVKITV